MEITYTFSLELFISIIYYCEIFHSIIVPKGNTLLDLHHLKIFLTTGEIQYFTLTARRIPMTQPGLRKPIQTPEQFLGNHLFELNGQRIELIDSGNGLIPLACHMVKFSLAFSKHLDPFGVKCSSSR
jgi:hypothetical protein